MSPNKQSDTLYLSSAPAVEAVGQAHSTSAAGAGDTAHTVLLAVVGRSNLAVGLEDTTFSAGSAFKLCVDCAKAVGLTLN